MASSFGEGAPDPKGILTNPWVLGAAGVAVLIGVLVFRRTSGGVPTGQQVPAGGNLPGAGVTSTDQLGLQTGGLEGQLANLADLIKNNIAPQGGNVPPGANSMPPAGGLAGQDPGWFYGALPQFDTTRFHVVWRYTSGFLSTHPQFSSQAAAGYGPPAGQPAPEYSWEYQLVPNS